MIGAGKRDRRVRFVRVVADQSGMGVENEQGGERVQDALAFVRYGTGAERRTGAAEGATQAATFRVISTASLRGVEEAGYRILDRDNGDVAWNIVGVIPVGGELDFSAILAKR